MNEDNPPLGVLTPDNARTILVVGDEGEVAVALRDKVDRSYALIKDIRPAEMHDGFATCIPWPWMVVGSIANLPDGTADLFRDRPILVYWRGPAPNDLPGHTRSFDKFSDLATAVLTALTQEVAGMKMAIGLGVDLPDGDFARSAELQALVAGHPHAFDVPLDAFRSAARVLATHRINLKPTRDPNNGGVALVEAEEASI